VRHAFSKCGGNLGTDGSVAYLFKKSGIISYLPEADEDRIMDIALEAGAEDVVNHDDGAFDVLTAPDNFLAVKEALVAAGLEPEESEVTMRPETQAELDDVEDAAKIVRLIDMLENLDDVQEVYSNASISDDVMEQIGA